MGYVGDFLAAATVTLGFNTVSTAGVPTTLTSGTISVYKNSSTTESTSGVTLTTDFDSRTGSHIVAIDTSLDGTFYAAGNDFRVELTVGTVSGTSVVGAIVGTFSLENRTQKADVRKWNGTAVASPATAGIPDVNAKNINNVATTSVTTINANQGTTQPVNFTGTGASALVKGDTIDWNSVAVTGMPMPTYTQPTGFLAATFPTTVASTTNITAGTITTVTNLTNAPTVGDFTSTMKTSIIAAVWTTASSRTLTSVSGLTIDANIIQIQGNAGDEVTGLAAFGSDYLNSVTPFALASTALSTVQWTNALATNLGTTATQFLTMTVLDGSVYQYTANALELAPSGGGGSLTATQNALLQSGTEK